MALAFTISRTSASKSRTTPSPSSPASADPANLRWPLTPFMRKASAATSSLFPRTLANFWSAWRSPTSTKSPASLRLSPSARKIPRAIRARRSPRPRKFTTTCACSSRAAAKLFASSAASWSAATIPTKSPHKVLSLAPGRRFYVVYQLRIANRRASRVGRRRLQEEERALRIKTLCATP